ncbi:DUF6644 family protein [Thalassospira australica]|uniref:DUF6644 family protein n=1 Tax=Thalassospira australica TaxID=1528106 RepID=UPI0038516514
MQELATWVEASTLAAALRGPGYLYMLVNTAHILGLSLMIGAIVPLDLRLVGIIRGPDIRVIGPFLSRAAGAGLLLILLTGPALWSVNAVEYLDNTAFLWKMLLVALGIATIVIQHAGHGWRQTIITGRITLTTRVIAATSLLIWLSTLLAGRWIGFL